MLGFLENDAYVQVKRNQFHVRDIKSGADATVQAQTPFTTQRLLIGDFSAAESTLKAALKQISERRKFSGMLRVLIHPLEMIEGGLSQIEDRILREVAIGAGASKVVVWLGPQLSDADVQEKLKGG